MAEASDPGVRIDRTSAGALAIVAPRGELDLHSVAPLRDAFEAALSDRPLILAVDLREVEFLDGGTVGELVAVGNRCEAEGRRLLLVRGSPRIDRVLSACGLEGHFELISGLDEIPGVEHTGGAGS